MNPPSSPENGNEGKKKGKNKSKKKSKKLDVPLLDPETSLRRSDYKSLLRALPLKKNYVRGRRSGLHSL